jgi:hypothetical protein
VGRQPPEPWAPGDGRYSDFNDPRAAGGPAYGGAPGNGQRYDGYPGYQNAPGYDETYGYGDGSGYGDDFGYGETPGRGHAPGYADAPGYGEIPGYDQFDGGTGYDGRQQPRPPRGKPGKGKAPRSNARQAEAREPETRALRARNPENETRVLRTGGPDSAQNERRSGKRRFKAVPVVAVASAFVVLAAIGTTTYYRLSAGSPGAGSGAAFDELKNSQALAVLDAERQTIADMNSAVTVVSKVSRVSGVSPSSVVSAAEQAAQQAEQEETIAAGELSPSAAMQVAQELMPDYGFSVSSQWSCLYDIWERESGWQWDAENSSSGAYGIPQSLPADKMASVASDYLTDATTQIKWGLGYIEDTYGSPCAAWDFELDNGFY